jgi:hypothetical protein
MNSAALCVSLRSLRLSAIFNAEVAEIRRGPQEFTFTDDPFGTRFTRDPLELLFHKLPASTLCEQ